MEDTSYIIKTKINDKYFVVNRNKSMVDSEVKPTKAISWWGLDDKKFKAYVLSDIEILEEVPYSNTNHKDQKILNKIKKDWRERLGDEVESTNISDEPIHELIVEKKRRITQAYDQVKAKYDILCEMDEGEITRIAIDLIIRKYHMKYAGYERWRIYKHKDDFPSEGHLIFFLFNRFEITKLGKKCYGIWMHSKPVWSGLDDCVDETMRLDYRWTGSYFMKVRH